MAKRGSKAKRIKGLKFRGNWNSHADAVRPLIKELDRRQAESLAAAHSIIVTNTTK